MQKFNKHILLALLILTTAYTNLFCQNKEVLKKQKENIQKEIKYTKSLLEKTSNNKKKSLNYLKVLQKQIVNTSNYLDIINTEIKILDHEIIRNNQSIIITQQKIKTLQNNLENLKKEYAKMIYVANKNKISQNRLIFVISAKSFNQAYKRLIYLKQYSFARKSQSKKIEETKKTLRNIELSLQEKEKTISKNRNNKKEIISVKQKEIKSIKTKKEEEKVLIENLSNSEKIFKKQIQKKEKEAHLLEKKIREIIQEEIRKEREKTSGEHMLTPEAKALSNEFKSNKGKLPWPLEKGIIIEKFGNKKHKVFAGVETFNNGIDLATEKNAIVRSVFDGKVSRIFFIKGSGKAILVNHGEYFSVYSGLKEVSVKTGEKVFMKEKIGIVLTSEKEEKTELHFEIWKNYEKQNPSEWLYRAY